MAQNVRDTALRTNSANRVGPTRDRMARVQVSDEVWSAFRAGLGATPASVALGRLVEREVAQRRRRTELDPLAMQQAVDEARAVIIELQALLHRANGGSVRAIQTAHE